MGIGVGSFASFTLTHALSVQAAAALPNARRVQVLQPSVHVLHISETPPDEGGVIFGGTGVGVTVTVPVEPLPEFPDEGGVVEGVVVEVVPLH